MDALERAGVGPFELRVVLEEEPTRPTLSVPEDARPPASAAPAVVAAHTEGREALLECARKDSGVARLLLEFGAQVVDIRGPSPTPEPMGATEAGEVEEPS